MSSDDSTRPARAPDRFGLSRHAFFLLASSPLPSAFGRSHLPTIPQPRRLLSGLDVFSAEPFLPPSSRPGGQPHTSLCLTLRGARHHPHFASRRDAACSLLGVVQRALSVHRRWVQPESSRGPPNSRYTVRAVVRPRLKLRVVAEDC